MNNYYKHGPYCVELRKGRFYGFTHCVTDCIGRIVDIGLKGECDRSAETRNLSYAEWLMVKDTKAENIL